MVKAAEREGKRFPMSLRISPDLRARLEQVASEAGRSLTTEIEHRLEKSFAAENAEGGPRTQALLQFISSTIMMVESFYDGRDWSSDLEVAEACRSAVVQSVNTMMKRVSPVANGLLSALHHSAGEVPSDVGRILSLRLYRLALDRRAEREGAKADAIKAEIERVEREMEAIINREPEAQDGGLDFSSTLKIGMFGVDAESEIRLLEERRKFDEERIGSLRLSIALQQPAEPAAADEVSQPESEKPC